MTATETPPGVFVPTVQADAPLEPMVNTIAGDGLPIREHYLSLRRHCEGELTMNFYFPDSEDCKKLIPEHFVSLAHYGSGYITLSNDAWRDVALAILKDLGHTSGEANGSN